MSIHDKPASPAVQPPSDKPIAGEWTADGMNDGAIRRSGDTGSCVANVYLDNNGTWGWNVYNNDCDHVIKHGFGCESREAAMAAADAWAREHATKLDWRLPDDAPESAPRSPAPVAGAPVQPDGGERPVIDEEREAAFRRGFKAGEKARLAAIGGARNDDRRERLRLLLAHIAGRIEEREQAGLVTTRERGETSALEEALRRWDAFDVAASPPPVAAAIDATDAAMSVLREIAKRLAAVNVLDAYGNCPICGMDESDDSHAFDCPWAIARTLFGAAPRNFGGEWSEKASAVAAPPVAAAPGTAAPAPTQAGAVPFAYHDLHTFCAQCGPNVRVDEDGDCMTCGSTAMGAGVDGLRAVLARLGGGK